MLRIQYLIITLLLVFGAISSRAQENELMLGVRAGHNVAFGGFAALSLETNLTFGQCFNIRGGAQYSTIGKTTLEARLSYVYNFSRGSLSVEALINYARLSSTNNLAAGAGIAFSSKWVGGNAGYYYRVYGGAGGRVVEPFNIYYELYANLLPMIDNWDLQLVITNNEIFELERHFQPSFIAQCRYYLGEHVGFSLGVGCKPAGMFNMSADYYQSYIKLGVCYRW